MTKIFGTTVDDDVKKSDFINPGFGGGNDLPTVRGVNADGFTWFNQAGYAIVTQQMRMIEGTNTFFQNGTW